MSELEKEIYEELCEEFGVPNVDGALLFEHIGAKEMEDRLKKLKSAFHLYLSDWNKFIKDNNMECECNG